MATGGFKPNATTDFLEEWKAKREKMRAKMLGDIAAATGAPLGAANSSSSSSSPGPRSSCSGPAPKRAEEGGKAGPEGDSEPDTRVREKRGAGPSARKGKGQIEKRKLREKRRSTGVVSIPSNESLDELDDDDAGEKDRREEEELVQANTFQNESMSAEPDLDSSAETPRPGSGHHKSSAQQASEEEAVVESSRQRNSLHSKEGAVAADGGLEKRIEELEKELAQERQENKRLLKVEQDKDQLITKLREEIDLMNRDLDDMEDENELLKQENKTLLKVVGQLTR
ncbi:PRKC apoptosis WT1 regulator protein [Gouania willdenowi]|uniref:PRKC apoptosis WT1 regulator protein n=1 Tax=Gouania willdenowi TaxID=441366 RepID=UPI001055C4C8|nr:PRKC apoptosis WT1 regulator protein [Gouania willdenowi]